MPLVQIHTTKGQRSRSELRKLTDVVQQCILQNFSAPPGDRYQIITQHEPGELICEDTGLDIPRSDMLVLLHIFQQGRDVRSKTQLYASLAKELEKQCGLQGNDLIISLVANAKEDWSFGYGNAQFLTVPRFCAFMLTNAGPNSQLENAKEQETSEIDQTVRPEVDKRRTIAGRDTVDDLQAPDKVEPIL